MEDVGKPLQSRQVRAAICSEGTRETDAAAEYQVHANAQALGAIPERKSEVLDRLWQTS